jgi:hypothetical protein
LKSGSREAASCRDDLLADAVPLIVVEPREGDDRRPGGRHVVELAGDDAAVVAPVVGLERGLAVRGQLPVEADARETEFQA